MNSPAHAWIGRCLGDNQRYRIDKRLGGGGMGDVFLAIDTRIGQQVALKLLKDTLVESSEMRQRFEREITISAALPSEHIVNVSDCGVTPEGYPFYVMEYLRGESLGDLLRRERRIGFDRTVKIITQICSGLLPAHQGVTLPSGERIQAVVHRDLKPDNIFLLTTDLGERVKIVDFGIAKLRDERSENLTLTNTFLGTLRYSSPEQMMGDKNLDGRADIYSLGVMMYEMLSGADPFGFSLESRRVSEASWIVAHTQESPKSLRAHSDCELFPPALEELVLRCLAKDPQQRFQSVAELSQSLQAIFAAAPDRTRVQSRPDFSGNLNPTNPPAASKSVEPAATIRRTPPSQPSAIQPTPVAAPDPSIAPVPPPATSTPASASVQPLTPAVVNPTPPTNPHHQTTVQPRPEQQPTPPASPHHQTTVQPRPEQQPTPPPHQPSPQKKAIDTRVKIAVGAVIGLGLAGGIYTYLQARSRTIVDEISGLNQQKNYAQCVAKAEETGTNGSNDRVQEILNECRLAYALELKEKGKLVEAINMIERIPKESPLYDRAQQYANDWRIL